MSSLFFDIETEADDVSEELEQSLFGKIEPTQTAIKKGEDAVREYIESKQKEVRADYALSPMTGRVKCICGIMDESVFLLSGDEKQMLTDFSRIVSGSTDLVTFNGKSFDVPFLKIRMAKLGVMPTSKMSTKRYDTMNHFDVREVLTNFGVNQKGTLRQWAIFFGLTPPEHDGAEIAGLSIEETMDKCMADVRITQEIYYRIMSYFA